MLLPGTERKPVSRSRLLAVILACIAVLAVIAVASYIGVQEQQPEQVDVGQLRDDLEEMSGQ